MLAQFLPAAVFWVGGLLHLVAARRSRQKRLLSVALFAFAAALTLDVATVYVAFDRAVGVPNLADLGEHVFGVLGVAALLEVLRQLTVDDRHRSTVARWVLPAAVVAALVVLFTVSPLSVEATSFTDRYGRLPTVAAYWAVTICYFAVSLTELARLSIRYSRHATRPALRAGLRTVGIGVGCGVVYSVCKIVELTDDQLDPGSGVGAAAAAGKAVLAVGSITIGIGLLIPVVARRELVGPVRAHRDLWLLRPLWEDLVAAVPHVVLGEPASRRADLLDLRHLGLQRRRRLIEILDAAMTLRPYAAADTIRAAAQAADAAGLAGPVRDATVEACWLRVAWTRKLSGLPPVASDIPQPSTGSAGGVDDEIRLLKLTCRAWRRSRLVHDFAATHAPAPPAAAAPGRCSEAG